MYSSSELQVALDNVCLMHECKWTFKIGRNGYNRKDAYGRCISKTAACVAIQAITSEDLKYSLLII